MCLSDMTGHMIRDNYFRNVTKERTSAVPGVRAGGRGGKQTRMSGQALACADILM